jgi:hypothetical protein
MSGLVGEGGQGLRQRAVREKHGAEESDHDLRAGNEQRRAEVIGVEGRVEGGRRVGRRVGHGSVGWILFTVCEC